jgi:hypothetical protein
MSNTDKLREIAEKHKFGYQGYVDHVVSEYTALISEHYYPKEFISYLMFDCDLQKELSNDFESEDEVIDRIFDFWTNNVKQ